MDDSTLVNLSDLEEELEENMPRRLKSYSNKFKLKVVSHAKRVSKKSASETHHVDRSSVREWVRDEHKLKLQS